MAERLTSSCPVAVWLASEGGREAGSDGVGRRATPSDGFVGWDVGLSRAGGGCSRVIRPGSRQGAPACSLPRGEGLLEFRRGRDIAVTGTPDRGAVQQKANDLVEFARQHGYRRVRG